MVSRSALETLSKRAFSLVEQGALSTEEAAKHALVLPFIQALGYDVFNPLEVVPEYTADFGLKQGEKVDYAIIRDPAEGKPSMIMECKKASDELDVSKASQLGRYFTQTAARIAILTNGLVYKFYSDLDSENVMDKSPFLEIDIMSLDARDMNALGHFAKHTFNVDEARSAAANMKHIHGIKNYLAASYAQPDPDFVRLLAKKVYDGVIRQSRFDHFEGLVKLAFQGFVNDKINDTLQRASDIPNTVGNEDELIAAAVDGQADDTRATTPLTQKRSPSSRQFEELEAYELVRTLVSDVVDPERVHMRDTKSYCGVLLDNNNRRPICRLWFNATTVKYLGLLDEERQENRVAIESIDDIANYGSELREAVRRLL